MRKPYRLTIGHVGGTYDTTAYDVSLVDTDDVD